MCSCHESWACAYNWLSNVLTVLYHFARNLDLFWIYRLSSLISTQTFIAKRIKRPQAFLWSCRRHVCLTRIPSTHTRGAKQRPTKAWPGPVGAWPARLARSTEVTATTLLELSLPTRPSSSHIKPQPSQSLSFLHRHEFHDYMIFPFERWIHSPGMSQSAHAEELSFTPRLWLCATSAWLQAIAHPGILWWYFSWHQS